jgi:hypothetical protein
MNIIDGCLSIWLLSYGTAAVDADDLAGHVGRRRHAQERHHGRHLLRLGDPPHGKPRHLVLHQLWVYRLLLNPTVHRELVSKIFYQIVIKLTRNH